MRDAQDETTLSERIAASVAADVAREGRAERRAVFGKHHFGHAGERARRKWRDRRRARVARASRQLNRRVA